MTWFVVSWLLSFLIWFYFIYRHDKIKKEPLFLLFLIAIFGGFISATLAGMLNAFFAAITGFTGFFDESVTTSDNGTLFMILVGMNEETIKFFITVAFIAKLRQFDEPIDGIIYSMTIALGFAAIENTSYMYRYGTNVILLRSVTSVPLHLGLAALWGVGITRNKFSVRTRGYFKTSFPYLIAAAAIHATYNSVGFYLRPEYVFFAVLAIAMIMIYVAHLILIFYLRRSPFIPRGFCVSCGRLNSRNDLQCRKCCRSLETNI